MNINTRHFFKNFKISITWIVVVTLLSLIPTPDLKEDNIHLIPHMDKIVHFTMYFVMCSLLLFEYLRLQQKSKTKAIIAIVIFSITYGALMEIAQYELTTYRSSDYLDILANTIGAATGLSIILYYQYIPERIKGLLNF